MKSIKNTFLTIIYLIILSGILLLNNLAFAWVTSKIVAPIFDWFYGIHWIWKILIITFGGGGLIAIFYNILSTFGSLINYLFSSKFPNNIITQIGSIVLCLINIIYMEIQIWPLFQFKFWIFLLWLIIAGAIIQVNWIFIYRDYED